MEQLLDNNTFVNQHQLVEQHIGLAMTVAHRLGRRHDEDIEQVAMLGLVKAAER